MHARRSLRTLRSLDAGEDDAAAGAITRRDVLLTAVAQAARHLAEAHGVGDGRATPAAAALTRWRGWA